MEDIERSIPYDRYLYITENIRPYTDRYMKNRQGIGLVKCKLDWVKTGYYVSYENGKVNIHEGSCVKIENVFITNDIIDDTFDNLINNGIAFKPYLIFVNNKHISWKDIVIINARSTYIYFPNIDNISSLDIYEFNFKIKAVYGSSFNKKIPYISFNLDGSLNKGDATNDTINYVVDRNDKSGIIINKFILESGSYNQMIDSKYKLYRKSVILFDTDGFLKDDYDDSLQINNFNTVIVKDISGIGLIAFNESQNFDDNTNFSNHFPNVEYWEKYLTDNNKLEELYNSLDIKEKKYLPKCDYYKDCVNQILSYNCRLMLNILDHVYRRHSIYNFKFKELRVSNFKLEIHKRNNEIYETGILLFRNGVIISNDHYSYNSKLNMLEFNTKGFNDEDDITVIYFKIVDNREIELELPRINGTVIDPTFDMTNAEMYSSCIPDQEYGIFNNRNILYKIDFNYARYDEDIYQLYPKDSSYYDSTVELHSKNKFHHYCIKANDDIIKIVLPKKFKTCRRIENYSVFIDGIRVSQSDIKLVYPTKTTPFKCTMIYLRNPVLKGHTVDVVYSPFPMKEIINIKNIDTNIITIDKDKLTFPLFPEFHLFFINGKLIDNSNIKYLSYNKIYIPEDKFDSKFNLAIVSMLDFHDEYLNELINNNDDKLTNIVNEIHDDDIRKLLNTDEFNVSINNDKDNLDPKIENKKILKEIVKDHWIESGLYQGVPKLYDYEKQDLIEDDNYFNNIIRLDILDAEKENKIGKNKSSR